MTRSVNEVRIIGTLGRDADVKFTPKGTAISRLSIATEREYKSGDEWKKDTYWITVQLWGNEKLTQLLTKGKRVYVAGYIKTGSYEDASSGKKVYTTDIVAENIILLDKADNADNFPRSESVAKPKEKAAVAAGFPPISDDDVPF